MPSLDLGTGRTTASLEQLDIHIAKTTEKCIEVSHRKLLEEGVTGVELFLSDETCYCR